MQASVPILRAGGASLLPLLYRVQHYLGRGAGPQNPSGWALQRAPGPWPPAHSMAAGCSGEKGGAAGAESRADTWCRASPSPACTPDSCGNGRGHGPRGWGVVWGSSLPTWVVPHAPWTLCFRAWGLSHLTQGSRPSEP